MGTVLLVDDDPGVLFTLSEVMEMRGHGFIAARSAEEALAQAAHADVVVTDLAMPKMDGMALLRELHERDASLPVILLTAHGNERVAVRSMKAGAYDYISKPFDNEEVWLAVERAIEARELRRKTRRLELEDTHGLRVVGNSRAFRRAIEATERVATKDVTVLIRGETGTGKELFATLLHACSPRSKAPIVRFNCAAIPHDLAEAQLFGYAKGAFTGASTAHQGYFVQANGGTLVLDEVGELSRSLQAKLLRVLQEREVQPLGATRVEKVDVRVVASTHRDLFADIQTDRFREDLYYRLAVVELHVPPLRDRREDIPNLAREFARKYSSRFGLESPITLSDEFVEVLERSDWPGNVRQLENTIARCVALATGPSVGAGALSQMEDVSPNEQTPSLKLQLETYERNILTAALNATGGNQSEASRRLGMTRASLYDRIKKYGLLGRKTS